MGGDFNGILIDASVLFLADKTGNPFSSLSPSADTLLRRLSYSKIRTAIFYEAGFSASKVALLEEMAKEKIFDSLILGLPSIESIASEVALWCTGGASPVLLMSSQKEDHSQKLKNAGWVTVILSKFQFLFVCRKLAERGSLSHEYSSNCLLSIVRLVCF